MKANQNRKTIAGWVLHGLVGGIMLLAASAKVLGFFPPEQVEKLGLLQEQGISAVIFDHQDAVGQHVGRSHAVFSCPGRTIANPFQVVHCND